MITTPDVLTIEETAAYLRVGVKVARRLTRSGRLRSVTIDARARFASSANGADQYLELAAGRLRKEAA